MTYEEAVKNSTSPSDFALLFRGVSNQHQQVGWTPGTAAADPNTGATGHDEFEIENFDK